MAMTIYETDIREHSGIKYKIQLRCNGGIWQQRHVWYPAPQTHVTKETFEAWITSIQSGNPPANFHRKGAKR